MAPQRAERVAQTGKTATARGSPSRPTTRGRDGASFSSPQRAQSRQGKSRGNNNGALEKTVPVDIEETPRLDMATLKGKLVGKQEAMGIGNRKLAHMKEQRHGASMAGAVHQTHGEEFTRDAQGNLIERAHGDLIGKYEWESEDASKFIGLDQGNFNEIPKTPDPDEIFGVKAKTYEGVEGTKMSAEEAAKLAKEDAADAALRAAMGGGGNIKRTKEMAKLGDYYDEEKKQWMWHEKAKQDNTELTAEDIRKMREEVLDEQEKLAYGLNTTAGLLGSWLPEKAKHLVPPKDPVQTPRGVEGIALHGGTVSHGKKVKASLQRGDDIRHPPPIRSRAATPAGTSRSQMSSGGDGGGLSITYTKGAMSSLRGDPRNPWSTRLCPGVPMYYDTARDAAMEVMKQKKDAAGWKEHPLLSTEAGAALLPASYRAPSSRPASVPAGYPPDCTPGGSLRFAGKYKTNTQMQSERRWQRDYPHHTFDIDGDGFVDNYDYQLSKRFDQDGNNVIDKEEMLAGKRIMAKELWEQHTKQESLAQPAMSERSRMRKMDELLALNHQSNGHAKFIAQYKKTRLDHWKEQQRGSSGVIACLSKPKDWLCAPRVDAHPVQSGLKSRGINRRPRTRTELMGARQAAIREEIRKKQALSATGGDFPRFDGKALEGNRRQRELFIQSDQASFKRTGGAFREADR